MDEPPPKRRRLRPIENLDWSLFEGMEAILGKAEEQALAVPKENGHDVSAPADVSEPAEPWPLQEIGHASAAAEKQPKLQAEATLDAATLPEDKEVVTTNTNKVIAAIPSAAKSRPRAKQKAKQEESAVADVPNETVDLSNGHDLSAEKQQLQAGAATLDAAPLPEEKVESEVVTTNTNKVIAAIPSAAKSRPRAKRKAKQDGHRDTDEPAAEAQADEGPASTSGPPLEGEEQPDTAAAVDPSPFGVPLPRRRRRVKLRRRRQADLFFPEAALFQPLGDPDSPQEQAFAAPPGPDPLKEAEEVLSELVQHQALMCKEVRISIEDRLQEVFQEWRCVHDRINTSAEYCVRQVLDAVSQGQHADATTLGLAIEEAQQLGLPERKGITDRLEQLKKLEEIEGVWQCLGTCLRDADRLGVVFWTKEAEDMGLEVPEVLMPALDAMRDEEAARLKRMELEASFNAQAAEAHARKDVSALRAMAQHAKATGQDPSAALAALEDLGEAGEADEVEEEELERLFVSSPNGQNHCFGMYVLEREERGNGMPVWRQLGGERWIYTDELGRWTVGSSKVRQNGFKGSAGFIFCPQKNHGVLPDKMQFWARFDEEAKKWKKDEDITIASEYQEEVIEPKFSKRAKGRAAKKSAKGKGKGAKGKEEKPKARAKPKAAPRAPRAEAKAHARPAFAQPAHHSGLTQLQAMRILELPSDRLCDLREEVINKAYRRLALRWHPDRHCNRHKKEEANAKFVELRNAFELMRDFLKAKKPIQDGAH